MKRQTNINKALPRLTLLLIFIMHLLIANSAAAISLFQDKSITQFGLTISPSNAVFDSKALKEQLRDDIIEQRTINDKNKVSYTQNVQINAEKTLLKKRLHSQALYGASITTQSRPNNKKGPLYVIDMGKPYIIEKSQLTLPASLKDSSVVQSETFNLIDNEIKRLTNTPVLAEKILTTEASLRGWLNNNACLYKINIQTKTTVAHKSQLARVNFIVKNSPKVSVGNVIINNNKKVNTPYLSKLIGLKSGECFKQQAIDNTRLKLIRTGLFTSITASVSEPKADNTVDITFNVSESLSKTTEVGLSFDNDDGAGIALGWEHRNIFGRAEKLDINTLFNQNNTVVRADLLFPNVRQLNQNLSFFIDVSDEKREAFEAKNALLGAELSRFIGSHITASVGAEVAYSSIVDVDMLSQNDEFTLFSTPFNYRYDKRNDPLNTQKGWAASLLLQPFWDVNDPNNVFVKSALAGSFYHTFDKSRLTPTLALRTAVGTINGANRDNVPINYRFFSGGGGSVRGFAFQSLGPSRVDPTSESDERLPTGGLSFSEIALEGRINITKSIGLVAFVDGGLAYEQSTPQLDEKMRFGAGIGFRYYTSFAPIRIDIATPINKEDNEDSLQLYISLGQAF